jgi:hypothetical protein
MNLPLEQFCVIAPPKENFSSLAQIADFFAEMHRLSYGWLKSVKPFRCYLNQHLSLKSLFLPQTEEVWQKNSQITKFCVKPKKAHLWPKPHRLIYNMWGLTPDVGLFTCPRKELEKTNNGSRQSHPYGRRDRLTDLNQIWHTWWSCLHNQFANFGIDRFKGFYSVRGRKWPFPILALYRP